MDRSRLSGAVPGVRFAADASVCAGADVVVVDLDRYAAAIADVRSVAPRARIVAYGPHVDEQLLRRARADGADAAVARSRLFRDPLAALATDGSGSSEAE